MKPQGLPPDLRVRKRRDFERAYAEGTKIVVPEFALYARRNEQSESRVGITTTKKLGNAVRRNRARRLVREAFRTHRRELPGGFDFVIVVRWRLLQRSVEELGALLVGAANEAAGSSA